jgi:putative peptidoglycan lipid II flippase
LFILAEPITAFLLQNGTFDADSSELVAGALMFYAAALFAHSAIEILSRGFYALGDTRTPVAFAVISMVVNLVLSLVLVWPFGVRGLAAALSVATIVEFALLLRTLDRRLRGLERDALVASVVRTVVATVVMAEVVLVWLAFLRLGGLLDIGQKPDAALASIGGMVLGAAAFYITTRALRSQEAGLLVSRLPLPERVRAYV